MRFWICMTWHSRITGSASIWMASLKFASFPPLGYVDRAVELSLCCWPCHQAVVVVLGMEGSLSVSPLPAPQYNFWEDCMSEHKPQVLNATDAKSYAHNGVKAIHFIVSARPPAHSTELRKWCWAFEETARAHAKVLYQTGHK